MIFQNVSAFFAQKLHGASCAGPVCTRPGGPVFLADGFARTEMSLNAYGRGRQSAPMLRKGRRFDVPSVRKNVFSWIRILYVSKSPWMNLPASSTWKVL